MPNKLTAKQEKFCNEYLIDLNATQAAIRAGYSKKTANEIGNQNLVKLSISERIAELRKAAADEREISFEWLLDRFVDESKIGDKSGERTSALKEVGKLLGYYEADNRQKRTQVNVPQFKWKEEEEE